MLAPIDLQANATKLLTVNALLCFQGVLEEEWKDALYQVLMTTHAVGHSVAVILTNHTASEVSLERMQHLHIAFVLYDGEFRQNLIACPSDGRSSGPITHSQASQGKFGVPGLELEPAAHTQEMPLCGCVGVT